MTVLSTDQPYEQYTGTGERTYFEYGFEIGKDSVIIVEVNGTPVEFTQQALGVVIEPAPALNASIVIARETPVTQERDFMAFEAFHGEKTEAALDKLIYLKQEASVFRAQINLTADHQLEGVYIRNDKGTEPFISIWDTDKAGVFAGEVTENMPLAGAVVEKPLDFVYFQYGDTPILTQTLTTTLYPLEATEGLAFTADIETASMSPIPIEDIDVGAEFVGGSVAPGLIDYTATTELMDSGAEFVDGSTTVALFDTTLDTEEMNHAAEFLGGSAENKLVSAYAPEEKLAMVCDVDSANCSMTPV